MIYCILYLTELRATFTPAAATADTLFLSYFSPLPPLQISKVNQYNRVSTAHKANIIDIADEN